MPLVVALAVVAAASAVAVTQVVFRPQEEAAGTSQDRISGVPSEKRSGTFSAVGEPRRTASSTA